MIHAPAADAELADAYRRITALEKHADLLRQQQDILLYTLSHDLRTPVMTILGFTDMLIADNKEPNLDQLTQQYLEHIRNSATRQALLIESLLNWSQLARHTLQLATVDLTQIAVAYCQAAVPPTSAVTLELAPTPPVQGDRQLLVKVMHALLSNAIKFSNKVATPTVSFGASERDGEWVYFVSDNGVGFNCQRADRLFQPFRRLHSAKDFDGLGMGLATAALIIQRHHGRIWADSNVGHGATLSFTLQAK